uniref:hypothetical protein n=1 Tax=Sporosarcina sp. FSL K6-1540 TaxID=2921555 RepID=UPI00406C7DD0
MKDAEWIAKLLRHGLLKASFIPDRNQRELRGWFAIIAALLKSVQDNIIGFNKC